MKRKILAMFLALCMATSLVACSGGDSSSGGDTSTGGDTSGAETDVTANAPENFNAEGMPIVNEEITVDTWIEGGTDIDWTKNGFVEAVAEESGVRMEVTPIAAADSVTQRNLRLASGDYPELFLLDWTSLLTFTDVMEYGVKEQVLMPITDYIDAYGTKMKTIMEDHPDYRETITATDGEIYGFPRFSECYHCLAYPKFYIRQDWLDDLGLEIPETPEEFVEVLRAFRDEKGATVPMSMDSSTLSNVGNSGCFTSAFGLVSTGYYQTDGQLHYGAYESAYKDYLAWLNELYTEGLLDRNFNTLDSQTVGANIMTGMSGVSAGYAGGSLGVWVPTARETTPEYALSGVRSLVAERGDTPMFSQHSDVGGINGYITSSCENVEAAIQFLNYGYTEPGNLLMNFGIEGESFEMKDGKPLYLDSVINSSQGFTQAIAQYAFNPPWGPYIQQADFCTQSYADYQNQALTDWADSDVLDHFVPTLAITENADQYSTIKSEVDTFISENFILFVTGEKSLNEFDSYLDTLKGMGIEDMIAIYQNAYDIYNS